VNACEQTRKYLDSYISNELLVETNHDLLRHLESCAACTAEADARVQLRTRLRSAVQSQSVPPELPVLVRERIRNAESRGRFGAGWSRWAMAAAASLTIGAGLWIGYPGERMPAVTDRPAQAAYIQKISSRLAAVLKVGLADHIHCAVFRKYPKAPPKVAQMESDLGPSFQGLLPVVRTAVPEGYRIVMGHQCGYAGRKYVHLTLEKNGELISLVIARKGEGETMDGLLVSTATANIPIFQSAAGRYQVAGFEAGNFLAYIVSDLRAPANLQIASTLAPMVHGFLMKTAA
jgi:anti-sigma factor RsiW